MIDTKCDMVCRHIVITAKPENTAGCIKNTPLTPWMTYFRCMLRFFLFITIHTSWEILFKTSKNKAFFLVSVFRRSMCVFKKEIWRYPHTPDNTQNTLYKQERNLLVRRLLQNGNCKMMKIVKTRLEKRLPEIFNCLVFCLRSERLLVSQ